MCKKEARNKNQTDIYKDVATCKPIEYIYILLRPAHIRSVPDKKPNGSPTSSLPGLNSDRGETHRQRAACASPPTTHTA